MCAHLGQRCVISNNKAKGEVDTSNFLHPKKKRKRKRRRKLKMENDNPVIYGLEFQV